MEKISISVFFPCYNEGENIGKLLEDSAGFLPTVASDHEIIVVDDGSEDATAEIAENFSKENPLVNVIRHKTNMGYGAALRTGFKNSVKEYIFFTDGDNQFNIAEISKLLPFARAFEIVAGFRIKRKDGFLRRFNAACFNLLVRFMFGLRMKDVDCAFKICRREVMEKMELESSGALINAEILIKARRMGCRIKETGVSHYPRRFGRQTGGNPGVILTALGELFNLKKKKLKT